MICCYDSLIDKFFTIKGCLVCLKLHLGDVYVLELLTGLVSITCFLLGWREVERMGLLLVNKGSFVMCLGWLVITCRGV